MNYIGEIIEAHNNNISVKIDKDENIYIAFDKYLYQLNDEQLMIIRTANKSTSFTFNDLGLWICELDEYYTDKNKISRFDDYYNLKLKLENLPIWVSEIEYIINNYIYGTRDSEWPKNYLYRINLKSGKEDKIEGEYTYLSHNLESTFLFARDTDTGLICFDLELNEKWSQPLDGYSYSKASQTSQFYEDLVIINHSSEILAYLQDTGEPRWNHHFKKSPGSFTVENGKIYCECDTDIIVLDAVTGEVLVQEPTGYPKEKDNVLSDQSIGVYPVGEALIFTTCSYAPDVRLFTSDGKSCLQKIDVWNNSNYSVDARNRPTIINGVIFQGVTNSQAYSARGLLVLKPVLNDEPPSIQHQQRLPIHYYAVPNLQVDHKYQVYIEGEHIDQIRRFAGIAIKELHFETGKIPEYNLKKGALDYKHNGMIELIADIFSAEENSAQVIEDLFIELNNYFERQNAVTAANQHKIKLKLLDLERSDWSMDGEILDLDKVRKEGKPLNSK